MSQNEQDDILAINLNTAEANKQSYYPNINSTIGLFFILLLYTFIAGIIIGIALALLISFHFNSPLLKSSFNLLAYISSILIVINYASRKSRKHQGYSSTINFNKIQGWLVPVVIISALALIIPLERSSAWIPMPKWIQKFFETAFSKDVFSISHSHYGTYPVKKFYVRIILGVY